MFIDISVYLHFFSIFGFKILLGDNMKATTGEDY